MGLFKSLKDIVNTESGGTVEGRGYSQSESMNKATYNLPFPTILSAPNTHYKKCKRIELGPIDIEEEWGKEDKVIYGTRIEYVLTKLGKKELELLKQNQKK